jgi:hypothetical protein
MLATTGGSSMGTKKPAKAMRGATPASSKTASGRPGTRSKAKAALTKRPARRKDPLWREFFDRIGFEGDPHGLRPATKKERMAYTLGLFYSQIQRNGSQLWLTNGYAGRWNTAVMKHLRELGTATARKAAVTLVEIRAIATLVHARERELTPADFEKSDSDPALDALAEQCTRLDRLFDKIARQLMGEVDTFLRDEPLRRARSSAPWPRLRAMTEEMKLHWC